MRRITESKMDEQQISPMKTLVRKGASKYLLLNWSVNKFNVSKISSQL
jgi:hypothetical protein